MKTTPTIANYLDTLKNALTALSPTGHNGFEGLVQAAFSGITGIPFRLSASGSQFGVDGRSVYADPCICFECKLYCRPVQPAPVKAKLVDLAIDDRGIDLWMLCSTSQISAQIESDVSTFCKKHGISTVILDWSANGLPPLAVMLAMASQSVLNFLSRHVREESDVIGLTEALDVISSESTFATQSARIREILTDPTTGIEAARVASAKWLCEALSDRRKARSRLGQPSLSPGDDSEGVAYDRETLVDKIAGFFSGPVKNEVLCIIGEEGTGKSWSVAQSWLRDDAKPLLLFISPSVFADTAEQNDVQDLLITSIIRQTGCERLTSTREKWVRILGQSQPRHADRIRFVVAVDGVNQRPEKDWGRILDRLANELHPLGGELIVTSRTSYYRNHIRQRLAVAHDEIEVLEWTEQERDAILARQGIVGADLSAKLASTLCNPRILGIALRLWTGKRISRFGELSVSRLLFEHIRIGESDAPSPQPVHKTVQFIRDHAAEMVTQLPSALSGELTVSEADLHAAAEGRFFVPIEDDPARYELTDEGLPLALAFLAIDRMRRCRKQRRDMVECLDEIVEPISALDRTSEVLVAAITVTCLDDRYDEDVTVALIRSFADLQNLTRDYGQELTNLATFRPVPFAKAARRLCLRGGTRPNFDLITRVLIAATKQDGAWSVVREHVESWLTHYTIGPRLRPRPFSETKEERQEKRKQELSKFQNKVDAFSRTEKSIVDELREVDGDLETLASLAFVLLAGRPRVPVAKSVVHCAYALALSTDYYRHGNDLAHLVQLNRLDWTDAREALLKEVEPLRSEDISTDGKWALVRVLRADRGSGRRGGGICTIGTLDRGRGASDGILEACGAVLYH